MQPADELYRVEDLWPDLSFSEEGMRELGYRAVDLVVEHLRGLEQTAPKGAMSESHVEEWRTRAPSQWGRPWREVLEELCGTILRDRLQLHHPRTFSHIPSPGNFVAAVADFLASGMNVFNGTWMQSRGPMLLEHAVLRWVSSAVGLPETGGGLVTTGGSEGNFLALAGSLHRRGDTACPTIYWSDQAHHSLTKAARVLRLPPEAVRIVPSDAAGMMDPVALARMIKRDLARGRETTCIVGTAGTTNTGAVDPLVELSEFARRHGAHFHVDAALAGALAMSKEGAPDGLELADSVVIDPHKWLFQPYEAGCFLVRVPEFLTALFESKPPYIEAPKEGASVDFTSLGLQQSRGFRALKIWLTLEVFGVARVSDAISRGRELASRYHASFSAEPDWAVLSSPASPIVACRFEPNSTKDQVKLNTLNRRIAERLNASDKCYIGMSVFKGRVILRLTPINPRTTADDIDGVVQAICGEARVLQKVS